MAAIVRVKRRIDEDPADSLRLQCKRIKSSNDKLTEEKSTSEDLENVFKFAATVKTKDAGVTSHVREAIKREKLEREYKHHRVNVSERARQTRQAAVTKERFKVLSTHRAIDLSLLDDPSASGDNKTASPERRSSGDGRPSQTSAGDDGQARPTPGDTEGTAVSAAEAAMFCLYDVEYDGRAGKDKENTPKNKPSETFTCNNMPMIREKVSATPQHPKFVYDIYYLNSRSAAASMDFRGLEDILTLEACREEHVLISSAAQEDNGMEYGEDEDSNDEDHWRNEYPEDEDGMSDEDGAGFCYNDEDGDDDDYQADYGVSDMLSKRLKIYGEDLSSDDDADLAHFSQPLDSASVYAPQTSFESYKRRVTRELGDGESDNSDGS